MDTEADGLDGKLSPRKSLATIGFNSGLSSFLSTATRCLMAVFLASLADNRFRPIEIDLNKFSKKHIPVEFFFWIK